MKYQNKFGSTYKFFRIRISFAILVYVRSHLCSTYGYLRTSVNSVVKYKLRCTYGYLCMSISSVNSYERFEKDKYEYENKYQADRSPIYMSFGSPE